MLVNQHTKIATLLRQHPKALDTIVAINPRFERLKNPFLRRIMANRTSIGMAARIAGCAEEDFYRALQPLGFEIAQPKQSQAPAQSSMPAQLREMDNAQVVMLDVRPVLARGLDPLQEIMETVKALQPGQALKIVNTFEPTPLIGLLKKKGFASWTHTLAPQLLETWFYRPVAGTAEITESPLEETQAGDWQALQRQFADKMLNLDVRDLEMPQPMLRILESLDSLPQDHALYVIHKRIPVFLLPELSERQFEFRSRQLSENEVHLLIFKSMSS